MSENATYLIPESSILEGNVLVVEDESEHGNFPATVIARYADSAEKQDLVRRAVSMSLMLRRQYFANLDRWIFEDQYY